MCNVGFIGCGNMGSALAKAAIKSVGGQNVYVCDALEEKAEAFARENYAITSDIETIINLCDFVFLAVKPQMLGSVFAQINSFSGTTRNEYVLVSMAAGVSISSLEEMAEKETAIIRIMPNMPVAVGKGTVLYSGNSFVDENAFEQFREIMKYAGFLDELEESKIDGATCISGCGPAFAFMFCEALADGGVGCGLPRDKAMIYAAQTLLGSALMLIETGEHPGALKDAVCSPAGSTIEGVRALENGGFRAATAEAVRKAYERTLELGK